MILKQYYLGCLAHASYLVADEAAGVAAVIDPQRDVDEYLAEAKQYGVRIRYAILTHFHADFVAGHLELRDRAGAEIVLGNKARADYPHLALADQQSLELGRVRLTAVETPGHSPESISLLLHDLTKDVDKPHAVFTGDTLFIGDVGRPDLRASLGWTARELAGMLYDSLTLKLLPLPDDTLVYPAHGAGSLCGKNLSSETVSTMGIQRRYNYALQPMTKEQFVAVVTAEQPDAPAYFSYDAVLNSKERPTLQRAIEKGLTPLNLERVLGLKRAGALLVDSRDPVDFAGAHVAGSLNIPLCGKYASWAGTLLQPTDVIVIVADSGSEEESVMRLGRIGFDRVAGFLEGGVQALDGHAGMLGRIERITVRSLHEEAEGGRKIAIVDVRTEPEWRDSHIEGSLNIPLSRLSVHIAEIPLDGLAVVTCRTGYRSSIAASLLAQKSRHSVYDLVGGVEAWKAAGLPVSSSAEKS